MKNDIKNQLNYLPMKICERQLEIFSIIKTDWILEVILMTSNIIIFKDLRILLRDYLFKNPTNFALFR